MVYTRQIINVIVEDILRPNLDNPRNGEDGNFIYSDSIDSGDTALKIGVHENNVTGTEMKRLGSVEKYDQSRIQADVQIPTGHTSEAFEENFSFPGWVNKPEDAVDYLSKQVKDLVVQDADKEPKSNSKIRSIGGNDEDVALEFDQITPVPTKNDILRLRVFFLAAHE